MVFLRRLGRIFALTKIMNWKRLMISVGLVLATGLTLCANRLAQESGHDEFGPVVRAYLGYLHDEQEVVDDRASRHEITPQYYRRNSNRIRALRKIAIAIARETNNDYLPELEAATRDELKTLFEAPPNPRSFRIGKVFNNMYRYLGTVRGVEVFYVFARLDPYEQAELIKGDKTTSVAGTNHTEFPNRSETTEPVPQKPANSVTGSP